MIPKISKCKQENNVCDRETTSVNVKNIGCIPKHDIKNLSYAKTPIEYQTTYPLQKNNHSIKMHQR